MLSMKASVAVLLVAMFIGAALGVLRKKPGHNSVENAILGAVAGTAWGAAVVLLTDAINFVIS
jgi:hypothetical protein